MKILVIEDDLALADIIVFTLHRGGFEVITAYDGQVGLERWERDQPDLVVLDLNLPKIEGLEVCRRIRMLGKTPIIILSVRNEDETVVKALELGADDYIVKPFSPTQLVARVRAVLRRSGGTASVGALTVDDLSLDRNRNEIQRPNQSPVRLTQLEARLLETLMLHAGQVLTTEQLIASIWGADGGDRTMLKQLVYRLRAKVESDTISTFHIETIPSIGYALSKSRP